MANPKRRVLLGVVAAVTTAFVLLTGVARGQEDSPVIAHGSEFLGSVILNGIPAPDGTPIEAVVAGIVCGTTTTREDRYDVVVRVGQGTGDQFQEGCATTSSEVLFLSGALIAAERGQFLAGTAQTLDLTFGSAAAPTVPPQFPDTGAGFAGGPGARIPSWLAWALTLTGIVAVGAAAIARGRAV